MGRCVLRILISGPVWETRGKRHHGLDAPKSSNPKEVSVPHLNSTSRFFVFSSFFLGLVFSISIGKQPFGLQDGFEKGKLTCSACFYPSHLGFNGKPQENTDMLVSYGHDMAMGHNLWLHVEVNEHPFATIFDVHQGYRVLTHSHI